MVSSGILKNCIEELYSITKTDMSVYDTDGMELVSAGAARSVDKDVLMSFIESPADSQVVGSSHLLKVYDDLELQYVVVATNEVENAYTVGRIAVSQLKLLLNAYKEKYDKNTFFQSLLMDNLLLVDVYNKAKKLRIEVTCPRVVYIVETPGENDNIVSELLKGMFSTQSGDFVTAIDEKNIILIKSLDNNYDSEELKGIAESIVDTINAEAMVNVRVGYGTVVDELKDVSKSYKEAMMSVDVGKIFYAERKVNSYSSLGIGRLIYQLPVNLCQMFIEEIFRDKDPATFDEEIVLTVYKFFENNLNVSETSRQMFIHRNTLVYRVEKLKEMTGLDVRVFYDAQTFMIAMMVYNYMRYLESENS